MKRQENRNIRIGMGLVLAAAVVLAPPARAAGVAPIDLKSCAHFVILAYSTITSTGGGVLRGDIGLSPAGSIVGFPPAVVTGTMYNGGPIAAQAQVDLSDAIIAAGPASLPGGLNAGSELGGQTLDPGIYTAPSDAYAITLADLILQGGPDDVWIFQMGSTLTVGTDRRVILTGGARAGNIFWQVGSSATLGTSSDFKGTILAKVSITMNANSTIEGRALAQTGAVTFNGSNGCLPLAEAPVFTHLSKTNSSADVVVLCTPAYFPLTLETCPDLLLTNWAWVATETPIASPWTFTNDTAQGVETRRFYRAFVTTY